MKIEEQQYKLKNKIARILETEFSQEEVEELGGLIDKYIKLGTEIGEKKFNCPNCNEQMELEGRVVLDSGEYDMWCCEDCSHILVLDWRKSNG